MIDYKKRNSLKITAAIGALGLLPGSTILANEKPIFTPAGPPQSQSPTDFGISELIIELHQNSVTFTNLVDEPIALKHFFPGSVFWTDRHLDLNQIQRYANLILDGKSDITIPAVSRKVPATGRLNQSTDSLWADDAIQETTSAVRLGSYRHRELLHTYPIPTINKANYQIA